MGRTRSLLGAAGRWIQEDRPGWNTDCGREALTEGLSKLEAETGSNDVDSVSQAAPSSFHL